MNLSAEENGILVKGFLKKRLIPYDDIKSIVAEAVQRIVVRTYGDVTQLTYLAEWDPKQKTGRYTMMPEAKDPETGKKYFLEIVSDFCDEYLEANSREYLDQLP